MARLIFFSFVFLNHDNTINRNLKRIEMNRFYKDKDDATRHDNLHLDIYSEFDTCM